MLLGVSHHFEINPFFYLFLPICAIGHFGIFGTIGTKQYSIFIVATSVFENHQPEKNRIDGMEIDILSIGLFNTHCYGCRTGIIQHVVDRHGAFASAGKIEVGKCGEVVSKMRVAAL